MSSQIHRFEGRERDVNQRRRRAANVTPSFLGGVVGTRSVTTGQKAIEECKCVRRYQYPLEEIDESQTSPFFMPDVYP